MKDEEKKVLIEDLIKKINKIEKASDNLSKSVGSNPESEIFKALYLFVDPMIDYVKKDIGDVDDWLNWYIWENDCGKSKLKASASKSQKLKPIEDVDDLLELINEKNKSNIHT